jgi:uridine phosphorylase
MPARLRPTNSVAAEAILVGDPGRALLLAQELLEQPKMSNHARGLWGYSGTTAAGIDGVAAGRELTIQSTGMGGPSAALVLADLAELEVRRAVRVGTGTALAPQLRTGELLAVAEAHTWSGGGSGKPVLPDGGLSRRLAEQVERTATVASLDVFHGGGSAAPVTAGDLADMQTAALFARARELGIALGAILIVAEDARGEQLPEEGLETAAKRAGRAAAASL